MDSAPLVFVDAHERALAASPERAWDALARVLLAATDRPLLRGYARLVGGDPAASEGGFPAEGSSTPGFRVVRATAPRELVLAGRHRFARYELALRLEPLDGGGRTRLVARTRAAFPGVAGAAYKLAVIRSGGHTLAMKALLTRVARAAERTRRP